MNFIFSLKVSIPRMAQSLSALGGKPHEQKTSPKITDLCSVELNLVQTGRIFHVSLN